MQWIDPALSLLIAAMILWSSWGIVRETLHILLEAAHRAALEYEQAARGGDKRVCGVRERA